MPLKLMVMNRLHNTSINGVAPSKVVLTSCWKHFSITRLMLFLVFLFIYDCTMLQVEFPI